MDKVKQSQITNLRVWCRRFNVEYNEERAINAVESASKYPGISGSVRRLPLALIFFKKLEEDFPVIPWEVKQFLAYIFATVMVAKVYDGNGTPWKEAVSAEVNRRYNGKVMNADTLWTKIEPIVEVAGEWFSQASDVREREKGTLGGMLSNALRNPQLMGD